MDGVGKSNTVHFLRKNVVVMKTTKVLALFLCCIFAVGCGAKSEDEPIIMVDASEEQIVYNMEEISMGEVVLTKNINCEYVQTKSQDVSFPIGGKIVDKVYVRVGDTVEVGDLLVALDSGNMVDEIAGLEYQIARNELQLGYLDKAEEFDRQSAYFSFAYTMGEKDEDAVKAYDENIESIAENYTYQREDYQDSLEFDRRKLAKLKSEYEGNCVYATMAGKVHYIKTNLEGSTAKKDDVVITIVDNDNGLFEIKDEEAAKYFREGEAVSMSIVYGDGKGDYELIPHNMNEWGETQVFEIIDRPESATLEVGVSGTIVAAVDRRDNVVRIPIKALYQADNQYYTYVLNEDNLREPVFIEIGLVGNNYAEVISGVEVGMKVVRR